MGLVSELRRRNVLRMAVLYAVAAWLIMQVAEVVIALANLPGWIGPTILGVLAVGFPIALIFSWFYELTPDGISLEKDVKPGESTTHVTGRRMDFIVISMLAAAVILFAYDKWWIGPPPEKSIAVLAFENMSADPDQEYFSDGISEELLNLLAQIPELTVISRSSAFSFKGQDIAIPKVAEQLNVAHVLEGSVRKMGNRVRIKAQLIEASTDSHLWSETYDRELEDIFAIQTEISGQIVRSLRIVLEAGEQEAMARAQNPTDDLEAYELYLRGRYFWQRRGEDNIRRAIDMLQQAIALDPQFARAYSSLAAAHFTLPAYADISPTEFRPQGLSAARKALALDDALAEAHTVIAEAATADREWAEAGPHYLRAIASEPKNATAHLWYGLYVSALGRHRDALEETLIAHQLDPVNPATIGTLARLYWQLDDTDNALKYGSAAWDLGIQDALITQVLASVRLRDYERATGFAQQYDDLLEFPVSIVELFVEASMDEAKIPFFVETLVQHENMVPIYDRLFILLQCYVSLGQIDEAYRVANMYHPWNGPRRPFLLGTEYGGISQGSAFYRLGHEAGTFGLLA